jgi:hypothetical protein
MLWWMWHPQSDAGGPWSYGFTPQNKPAEQVLSDPPTDPPRSLSLSWAPADPDADDRRTASVQARIYLDGSPADFDSVTVAAFRVLQSPASPDFDGSGVVDFTDFLAFAAVFGACKGDADHDARFDLDGDGCIVFQDFLLLATRYGQPVLGPVITGSATARNGIISATLSGDLAGTYEVECTIAAAQPATIEVTLAE